VCNLAEMASLAPPPSLARFDAATWRAVIGLGITQLFGWGSTFYLLTILGPAIARDLRLSPEIVSAGQSLMLIISGITGPRIGRIMDVYGARPVMIAGSMVAAAGLLLLSQAQGLIAYLMAFVLIGLSGPLALYNAAFTGLTQVAGNRVLARRAITYVTFPGGLASTLCWPLSVWLEGQYGWRITCLAYAVMNGVLLAALHAYALPKYKRARPKDDSLPATPEEQDAHQGVDARAQIIGFWAFALMLALNGFFFNGISVHLITVLGGLGYGATIAVTIAMLVGISQVVARLLEMLAGDRYHPLITGLISGGLLPLAIALLLLDSSLIAPGYGFAMLYGASNGLLTIARGTITLHLFGTRGYGERIGKLTLGQNMAGAVAPIVMAWLIMQGGASIIVLLGLITGSLAFGAMIVLWARTKPA
jgi:MFS family permease